MTTRAATTPTPSFGPMPPSWRTGAACKNDDQWNAWHPDEECGMDPASAKEYAIGICRGCPVRTACLRWSLEVGTSIAQGIWGGTTEHQRREFLKKNRRLRNRAI